MKATRVYLGVLLGLMGLGQLLSLSQFKDAVADYESVGSLDPVLATLLIALELAASVGLLAPVPAAVRTAAAWLGVAAASLWSLLAVQGLLRGLDVDNCGCFGRFLSQPLSLWVVPQDALFLLTAGLVVRASRSQGRKVKLVSSTEVTPEWRSAQ